MATVTKPIALDESINTTESSSRNIADVLAQELSGIASAITGGSDKANKTDIATVEPTNTASRAYSVGELVYVNGNLYKVITTIASGATFTVGTNIQSTNVSESVKDALDKINNKFSSNRVIMGITDTTKTYTAPSNGMIWVRGDSASVETLIAINGIPRLISTANSDVVSIVVYKDDVISVSGSGVQGGGAFYPQL